MKYSGTIRLDNGVLKLVNKAEMIKFALSLNCKEFTFTLEKKRNKRSNQLNKYYWSCVVNPVMRGLIDIGYDMDLQSTHEFLKAEFNYKEIVNQETGEIKRIPLSTTNLTNTEQCEMIEKIKRFAIEWLGVYIADAGEQTNLEL